MRCAERYVAATIPIMTQETAPTAQAHYIGSTTAELAAKRRGDRIAAGADQKVLFPRRGAIALFPDRLVLKGWNDAGDLMLRPAEVVSIENRFTDLYGRFLGGLLDAGKPLVVRTSTVGEIYLMVDHKTFMETTDNRRWARLLDSWRHGG